MALELHANLEDLEGEDKHRAGRDVGAHLAVAVRDLRGNGELPLAPLRHYLHRLRPARDDLIAQGRSGVGFRV